MRAVDIFPPGWARQPRFWVAAAVAICGLVNLLEGLLPKDPDVLAWMAGYLPFEISEHSRMLLLGGGLLQLTLARGLFRGKRMAWALALVLVLILPFLHLSRAWDWHHAIAQAFLAAALILLRKHFPAMSDRPSVRWALIFGGVSFVILTIFGLLGIESVRGGISGERGFFRDVQTVWELVLLQGTDTLTAESPDAAVVFSIISKSALMLGFVTVTMILRPILPRSRKRAVPIVREIVSKFGKDPLDEFAFLPDKHHFHDPQSNCFVSYALWRNIAVTLSDPVGPAECIPQAISAFRQFCTRQDWTPVFYEIREEHLPAYRKCGFRIFKFAEDARITLPDFTLAGKQFQNLRTAQNKIQKSGMNFSWHTLAGAPPGLYAELHRISQDWIAARHAIEMTFDLGSFSADSLRQADICVLQDESGRAVAFATWLPYAQGSGRALDLMRHYPAHRGVMDALILEGIQEFQRRGCKEASLGNAPLANINSAEMDKLEERGIRALFDKFDRYYGYKSLFEFKKKFQPGWQSRFIAYPGIAQIVPVTLAIIRVHLPSGLGKFLRS